MTEHEISQENIMSTDTIEATASNDEDTVYYGQSEISKDDIIFVPHVTVEIPEQDTGEASVGKE